MERVTKLHSNNEAEMGEFLPNNISEINKFEFGITYYPNIKNKTKTKNTIEYRKGFSLELKSSKNII